MGSTARRKWINGLVGAVISGAANGITVMIVDPLKFNLFQGGAVALASVVLASGIVGAGLYLKTHQYPMD